MIASVFEGFWNVLLDVSLAFLPLLLIFVAFNVYSWKLPRPQLVRILRGLLTAFIGLVLFLQGANAGFIKVGGLIGNHIGRLPYNWILIPIGFLLGFVVAMAEPAIKVLNFEVEKVTGGYINNKVMLYFLSFGVALAVSLSMVRILTGISIWFFLVPGYLLAFILSRHVKPIFVALAFDSGGVVTGPMIATFLLAFAVGSSEVIEGSTPIFDGFGMIGLVAMFAIVSILTLGLLYSRSEAKGVKKHGSQQEA